MVICEVARGERKKKKNKGKKDKCHTKHLDPLIIDYFTLSTLFILWMDPYVFKK